MRLDLRVPIGLMFTIMGAILVLVGLFADRAIDARSLGLNVNLWWGLVLLAVGALLLWLGWRAQRAPIVPGE
jgi:protein-S-isoprenylcysteine O-methyltransferase Ste14